MSKILVTGVAGLLGSHFSKYLLDLGHTVVGIDNFSGGYEEFVDPRVKIYNADLKDVSRIDAIFFVERPDYVYHFAAYAAVGLSPFVRSFNYTNNVVASANVINGCIKYNTKKIIFTSSMDVYGSQYVPPYTEDFIPMPEDPYGIAKYAVEQDLAAAGRFFGLRYTIVRPHNVFGVQQNIWDKYRNVIGIWIRQTLSDQPITVYGDGSHIRSFSDVKYYMSPFEKLMTMGDGEIFNIGADSHMSILDAANRFTSVAAQKGKNVTIKHLQPRDEVKFAYCDHTKAKNHLQFSDNTDFDQLVGEMFTWAENQPFRPVKTLKYEVEKNMYDFWKK